MIKIIPLSEDDKTVIDEIFEAMKDVLTEAKMRTTVITLWMQPLILNFLNFLRS